MTILPSSFLPHVKTRAAHDACQQQVNSHTKDTSHNNPQLRVLPRLPGREPHRKVESASRQIELHGHVEFDVGIDAISENEVEEGHEEEDRF